MYAKAYNLNTITEFIIFRCKRLNLTKEEFASKAGVSLTVIRKIEQGKENLVLKMFGNVLGPVNEKLG